MGASNFIISLANIVHWILTLYMYIVIARAVISWINVNPYNQIVQFLYRVTEPPLAFIRSFIPPIAGLDLSPVILIFAVLFLERIIIGLLISLA